MLLRDVRAWDPTLLRHDGRYWLFVTMAAPGVRPSDELCLYSADSLTGPWSPHPRNPIVSDARRARPAGRILADQGHLVRPSQDGSGAYGRRIVLNRIDVLTPDDYQESRSARSSRAGCPAWSAPTPTRRTAGSRCSTGCATGAARAGPERGTPSPPSATAPGPGSSARRRPAVGHHAVERGRVQLAELAPLGQHQREVGAATGVADGVGVGQGRPAPSRVVHGLRVVHGHVRAEQVEATGDVQGG